MKLLKNITITIILLIFLVGCENKELNDDSIMKPNQSTEEENIEEEVKSPKPMIEEELDEPIIEKELDKPDFEDKSEYKEVGDKIGKGLKKTTEKVIDFMEEHEVLDKTKEFFKSIKEGYLETDSEKRNIDEEISEKERPLTNTNEILKKNPKYYSEMGEATFKKEAPKNVGVIYGDLDKLGRATWSSAIISKEIVNQKTNRGSLEDPAGWPEQNDIVTVQHLDGTTYKGYFWNRSHMVAADFGGNGSKENLVTATRAQNVGGRSNDGGMAYAENLVREYFNNGGNGLIRYEVENIYNGTELLPRETIVNILSTDNALNKKVMIFNLANGYNINYNNGTFTEVE